MLGFLVGTVASVVGIVSDDFAFLRQFNPKEEVSIVTWTDMNSGAIYRAWKTILYFKAPWKNVLRVGQASGSPLFPRNRPPTKELFLSSFWPISQGDDAFTCGLEVYQPTERPPKPIGFDENVLKSWSSRVNNPSPLDRNYRDSVLPGYRRFPHSPENNDVYQAISRLRKCDLFENLWPYHTSGPPPYRFEIVASIRKSFLDSMEKWKTSGGSNITQIKTPIMPTWRVSEIPVQIRAAYCLPDYKFLIAKFADDLRAMSLNLLAVNTWLKEVQSVASKLPLHVAGQFQDVPYSHWAANAVESLRWQGLLKGYPGGAFQGKSRS